jgi:hypothetical protein
LHLRVQANIEKSLTYFSKISFVKISLLFLISGFIGMLGSFVYSLFRLSFLSLIESDFLSAFPTYEMSKFFGKELTLFDGSLAQKWLGENDWNYGPLHQLFTIPLYFFNTMSEITLFLFFFLFSVYVLSILGLTNLSLGLKLNWKNQLAVCSVLLINYPFLSALQQRNLEILELFFIVSAMFAYKQEKYFLAGALIAVATGIKFFPAVIVIQFLLSRNWQAVKGFIYLLLPQLLITQVAFGWQNSFTLRLVVSGESGTVPLRQGLNDLILRFANGNNETILKIVYLILAVGLFITVIYILGKNVNNRFSTTKDLYAWSILLALICIIAPHSNNYYFVLLAPLIVQIHSYLEEAREKQAVFIYALGLILLSAPMPLAILWRVLPESLSVNFKDSLLAFQSYSPMFFGSMLLLILGLYIFSKPNQDLARKY